MCCNICGGGEKYSKPTRPNFSITRLNINTKSPDFTPKMYLQDPYIKFFIKITSLKFKHNMAWRINTNPTVQTQFEHFLSTHIVLKTLVTNLCFLATYFHLWQMMSYLPQPMSKIQYKIPAFHPNQQYSSFGSNETTKTKMKLNNQTKQIKSPK